jgi:hypothetical protein
MTDHRWLLRAALYRTRIDDGIGYRNHALSLSTPARHGMRQQIIGDDGILPTSHVGFAAASHASL